MRTMLTTTDQLNAEEVPATGTTQQIPYQATVPCTTTPTSTTTGSTCNLNTTADSLVPGTIAENRRIVWQLGQIEVRDAGLNLTPGDGDDNTFLRQGVFVP
jgi:hypothetical protein